MQTNTTTTETPSKHNSAFMVLGLATEIGFIISVPLVVLMLLGVWLDQKLGATPLFILTGVALSLVISTSIIARKIRALNS